MEVERQKSSTKVDSQIAIPSIIVELAKDRRLTSPEASLSSTPRIVVSRDKEGGTDSLLVVPKCEFKCVRSLVVCFFIMRFSLQVFCVEI